LWYKFYGFLPALPALPVLPEPLGLETLTETAGFPTHPFFPVFPEELVLPALPVFPVFPDLAAAFFGATFLAAVFDVFLVDFICHFFIDQKSNNIKKNLI
jgi:hypothetical protein